MSRWSLKSTTFESHSAYNKALKAARIANGLCIRCPQLRGEDGTVNYCRSCADKLSAYRRAERKQNLASELCRYCGSSNKTGKLSSCEKCYDRRLERTSNDRLKKLGVSPEQYLAMLEEQNGCCKVCGKSRDDNGRELALDHCHKTGKVRGLLCRNCNLALGLMSDNLEAVLRLAQYLAGFQDKC